MQNIKREPFFCTLFAKQKVCPIFYIIVFRDIKTFQKTSFGFTCLQYTSFENTKGKGEIAHNEQLLLFPQCFLTIWKTFCHVRQIWNRHLQTLSVSKGLKFVLWEILIKSEEIFIKFFKYLLCYHDSTLYQTINFGLVQIESIRRWQIRFDWKIELFFGKSRKQCGKRRKCWLPAFSPFPTMLFF